MLCFLFLCVPAIEKLVAPGTNCYTIYVSGEAVGSVDDPSIVSGLVINARKKLASETEDLLLLKTDYVVKSKQIWFGSIDNKEQIENNIYSILKENVRQGKKKAYTLKINQYIVNLASMEDITTLLTAVKDKYDVDQKFGVELVSDKNRGLNVTTTDITRLDKSLNNVTNVSAALNSGVETPLSLAGTGQEIQYEQGVIAIDFAENVEIVESYVDPDSITPVEQAINDITKDKEKNKTYEVVKGDCLSIIAEKTNTTVSKIIEINENIPDENATIQIGDEITVTIPEPELSVVRQEEVSYEEDYNADVIYIDNDSWYTTQQQVRQESSQGHRSVVAIITYRNNSETGRDIIYENVMVPAVPKIIERGTKTPPTYIKPLSGGAFTSGFGRRWGKMHKGIDWACPVGTAIKASCSGTVARAGWASGYGYVVYINHPDGRQTRYGHLSKILVKVGQKVQQGDKIALSGNTGRSTGPHVHFEILINGSQVNPLNYLN